MFMMAIGGSTLKLNEILESKVGRDVLEVRSELVRTTTNVVLWLAQSMEDKEEA